MNLLTLLDMVAGGNGDITLLGTRAEGLTGQQLQQQALAAATLVREASADTVIFLDGNGPAFPVALFASAYAGVPFLPINFRLSSDQIDEIISRSTSPLIVTDNPERAATSNAITTEDFLFRSVTTEPLADPADPDVEDIAVLLMTSGTTAAPKSAVLRHRHLTSYVLGSVEFASAEPTDATIVSVPPYHIAAVANLLSNLFAGRRIVYLDQFTPRQWLDTVKSERISNAMVVPTMLVRIVRELLAAGETGPASLKGLSYGGAKISAPALAKALELFPDTGFVNAYGLTETASSIAVLGPDDHRDALASDDPNVRARLASVGRALPTVEIEVHDADGSPVRQGKWVTSLCAVRRWPASISKPVHSSIRTDGSPPAISVIWTPTVSSSSRAEQTTRSSAAVRTLLPLRSRLPLPRTSRLPTVLSRGSRTQSGDTVSLRSSSPSLATPRTRMHCALGCDPSFEARKRRTT